MSNYIILLMRTRFTYISLLLLSLLLTCTTRLSAEDLVVSVTEQMYLCQNQSVEYRGILIDAPGIYYDTLYSTSGERDSLVQIVVNTAPAYLRETRGFIVPGNTYTWAHNGQTYNKAGVYYDNQRTAQGCDSVFRLVLEWNAQYRRLTDTAVCRADLPFRWRGKLYYESAEDVSVGRGNGVDSLFELKLRVSETYEHNDIVWMCDDAPFFYRGKPVMKGMVTDTFASVGGCDSIVHVYINRAQSYHFRDTLHITNQKHDFTWQGEVYSTGGTFFKHFQTVHGCDSVYELTILRNPVVSRRLDTVLCSGELPLQWRGNLYSETGTYFDSVYVANGTDTVFILNLIAGKSYINDERIELCEGTEFNFRGKKVTAPGIYSDTLQTIYGCDSVFRVIVNNAPTYHFYETAVLNGETNIEWHGQDISIPGTYKDEHKTVYGCDSVYELSVMQKNAFRFDTSVVVCQGVGRFNWRGNDYFKQGTYYDHYVSSQGTDSIYVLHLDFLPTVQQTYIYKELCKGDFYTFRDMKITEPDIYRDTMLTKQGCDSIVTLVVNRAEDYKTSFYAEVCAGSYYDFHGRKLFEKGNYYDTLLTVNGCDSVQQLVLNIAPVPRHTIYGSVCHGETYQFRGRKLTESGVYNDTLVSAQGCDSILTLVLNVGDDYYYYDTLHKGDIDTVMWRGQKIVAAGTYYDRHVSVTGCDSVTELAVFIHPTYHFHEKAVICENDEFYEWQGGKYSQSGVYTVMFRSVNGTDSIYVLDLTVNPVVRTSKYFSICSGETITYNGRVISEPTEFRDTLITATGCDSIIHVIVNRAQTYLFETDASMHDGGKYEWRDKIYTEAGVYYDSLFSVQGCDSVYKLTLHANPVYYFRKDTAVCESSLPFNLNGHKLIYGEGVYYDSLNTFVGADSVYELHLSVNKSYTQELVLSECVGGEIYYGDTVFRTNTIYYDSLLTVHGCDSIIKVIAVFTPGYVFSETRHLCKGDVLTWHGRQCSKTGLYSDTLTTVSGCDSIYRLNLVVHRQFLDTTRAVVCKNELPFIWRGDKFYETGFYYDSIVTPFGCDSVYQLSLTVNPTYEFVTYRDVCSGDFILLDGDTVRKSCTREKHYYTATGCDSIYRTIITFKSTDTIIQNRTICSNDTFSWRGQQLTRPNRYVDAMPYSNTRGLDCDSVVYILNLAIDSAFIEKTDTILCQDSLPFFWRDRLFWTDTLVADTFVNHLGCDSIYQLQIQLAKCSEPDTFWLCPDGIVELPTGQTYDTLGRFALQVSPDSIYRFRILPADTFHVRVDTVICSSRMPFRNKDLVVFADEVTVGSVNVISQTLQTVHGCDSTIEWHLTVWPSDTVVRSVNVCQNEPYYFKGRRYNAPCVFYDTILTTNSIVGCDSIVRYVLNSWPTYTIDRYDTISEGDTYTWQDKEIRHPGTHIFRGKTVNGCDSIIRLHLALQNAAFVEDTVTICYGSPDFPYVHNRKQYRTSTVLKDTFVTEQGYDSIVWTHLVIHPRIPETVINVNLCDGEMLHIRGEEISQKGNYFDTLASRLTGCDSVIHYVVNRAQTYFMHKEASFCSNRGYRWYGHHNDILIRRPGIYYDSLRTVGGCDSVFELVLTSKQSFLLDTTILVCYDELPYRHEGRLYYESRLFADTFTSASCGCDSIRRFNYVLTNRCSEPDRVYRCGDEPFRIGAAEFFERGAYRFPNWSDTGLDSVYRFVLDTAKPSFESVRADICFGDSLLFEGLYYSKPGTYRVNLESFSGCDSIRELTLAFNTQPVVVRRAVTIADYQLPYLWRNSDYVRAGSYTDYAYRTATGCVDTLYQLDLEVLPTTYDTVRYAICRGDSVLFAGRWYKSSVLTADTLDYRRAGRSAITQLVLHVQDSTRLESISMRDDCADASEMIVSLNYSGAAPEKYSVEFIGDQARQVGFEDIIDEPYTGEIRIPVPQQKGDAFYTAPGEYRFRLSLGNSLCGNTAQETAFMLKYPSWIMEQNWGNVVALLNSAYNGGYNFVGYKWTVLGRKNIVSTKPYLESDYLEPGDSVIVSLSRDGEHYVPSCPLVIREYAANTHPYPILVYPTSAPRARAVVTLEAEEQGTCGIYNAQGTLCGDIRFVNGKQEILLPQVPGCYMLVFRTAGGYSVTRKILVY